MTAVRVTFEIDPKSEEKLRHRVQDKRTRIGPMMNFAADPLEQFVAWWGNNVAKVAKQRIKFYDAIDTGKLYRSIEFRWTASGGGRVGAWGYANRYARFVHDGSRAHWTSVRNLSGWAKRHGANVYAVQWGIAHKDQPPKPFLTDAIEETNRYLAPRIRAVGPVIQREWGG